MGPGTELVQVVVAVAGFVAVCAHDRPVASPIDEFEAKDAFEIETEAAGFEVRSNATSVLQAGTEPKQFEVGAPVDRADRLVVELSDFKTDTTAPLFEPVPADSELADLKKALSPGACDVVATGEEPEFKTSWQAEASRLEVEK